MGAKLVIITLLAGIGFFNYHDMVSLPIQRAGFMFMLLVCLAYALRQKAVTLRQSQFPRLPWFIMMACLIISMFMAPFYHPQSLSSSIIAQSTNIMAYGSFFILLMLNPDPKQLFKLFYWVLGATFLVYIANFVTMPNNIFGSSMNDSLRRGTWRITIPLIQVVVLMFYYFINRWLTNNEKKWIVFASLCYLIILMSLTRQLIAITTILGLFQVLSRMGWVKKIVIGLFLVATGYVVVIHLPIYKAMKDVTVEQIDDNEEKEDVRIGAWRYYSYEAHEHVETFFMGNGTPALGKSPWGKKFDAYADETGYFVGDVSYPSCIYLYGLIFTLALLVIIFLAIFKHKRPDQKYLTYFFITVLLQGIASGVWYYYWEIFVSMIALYLLYRTPDTETDTIVEKVHGQELTPTRRFITE